MAFITDYFCITPTSFSVDTFVALNAHDNCKHSFRALSVYGGVIILRMCEFSAGLKSDKEHHEQQQQNMRV